MKLMHKLILTLLIASTFGFADDAKAPFRDGIYFTGLSGGSYSFDSKLKIERATESYSIDGQYRSRSFDDSPYWIFRIEKWKNDKAYGFELIHHKVYLRNPSGSLEFFDISDGYNLALFTKAWRLENNEFFRIGAGGVLVHPHSKFTDGTTFHRNAGVGGWGYFLAGPAIEVAFEKWIYETKNHFITLETKLTFSSINTPVEANRTSYASMDNVAIHFAFGLGSKPINWKTASKKDKIAYFAPGLFPKVMDYTVAPLLKELTTHN